ncbi:MAG: TIGR03557 family F420-dependent LLM class oxidoreductase [Gaiellaceae bacterium]
MEVGFAFSSEDHPPQELVRQARAAEEAGFGFGLISDHFHPWADAQGQSPFVWSVIGGIAQVTERFRLGTGVTCPIIRIHPAIVAQAAATCACMMPGRFFLGVGTGENLNEHVLGDRWPLPDERLELLEEAVAVIRLLFQGGEQTHRGTHYTVDHARLYTVPDEPPEIYVAASAPKAAGLAGRIGDGLISTAPKREIVESYEAAGGTGKQKVGMIHCAYDRDARAGLKRAHEQWPNLALKGPLGQELATPADFEQAAGMVREEDVAELAPHGPDPAPYLTAIGKYADAGFTHVYVHQIGQNQDEFLEFAANEVIPRV